MDGWIWVEFSGALLFMLFLQHPIYLTYDSRYLKYLGDSVEHFHILTQLVFSFALLFFAISKAL